MTRPGTPARTIRVPDDLWQQFRAAAEGNGTSASAILLAAVNRYVRRHAK